MYPCALTWNGLPDSGAASSDFFVWQGRFATANLPNMSHVVPVKSSRDCSK